MSVAVCEKGLHTNRCKRERAKYLCFEIFSFSIWRSVMLLELEHYIFVIKEPICTVPEAFLILLYFGTKKTVFCMSEQVILFSDTRGIVTLNLIYFKLSES